MEVAAAFMMVVVVVVVATVAAVAVLPVVVAAAVVEDNTLVVICYSLASRETVYIPVFCFLGFLGCSYNPVAAAFESEPFSVCSSLGQTGTQ